MRFLMFCRICGKEIILVLCPLTKPVVKNEMVLYG